MGELRRLERDLHDGVQNELVALIIKLGTLSQDPELSPGLARQLSGLEARAQSALDSVRDIARGLYPQLLADFGLVPALRAQSARAQVPPRVCGSAPRSTDEAEAAAYFSCSEAIQNVAKHAGPAARATVLVDHDRGQLTIRIDDDGHGFDPRTAGSGSGLANMLGRAHAAGGALSLISEPGCGTSVAISLPWPPR